MAQEFLGEKNLIVDDVLEMVKKFNLEGKGCTIKFDRGYGDALPLKFKAVYIGENEVTFLVEANGDLY